MEKWVGRKKISGKLCEDGYMYQDIEGKMFKYGMEDRYPRSTRYLEKTKSNVIS